MIDRTTVWGLVGLVGLLAWVMLAGAGSSAHVFWQTPALAFVIGGALIAAFVACPGMSLRRLGGVLRNAFVVPAPSSNETIITLVALAEVARRDGLLALDKTVAGLRDDFTRRAMQMAIDGVDPEVIQTVCQAELESIDLRHAEGKAILEAMARFAPALGMMGTLIGLVIMLGRMDDPSHIGPGMAVALLTTLYGLGLANLFCLPLARRLAYRSSQELLTKTVAIKGVLGIQAGDNPRVLAQKLRAYLPGAGIGQDFSWATLTRTSAHGRQQSLANEKHEAARTGLEGRRSASAIRTGGQAASGTQADSGAQAAGNTQGNTGAAALDEDTARQVAEQLQKMLRGHKRFVDAA